MQLPARSTLAGGIVGLATWGLSLLLAHYGVQVPQDAVGGAVALLAALASHFCPDTLKDQAAALNVKVEDLAAWLPEAVYPDQKKPQ